MRSWPYRAIALLCAAVCAAGGSLPLAAIARADSWCRYDARGELVERHFDTNGDGRPDVAEYYCHGVLLRRDSDRDFNGVTDLVEDFDADTHEHVRSIVDENDDGTADVLLLYPNGQPILSERAAAVADGPSLAGRAPDSRLLSLRNPFAAERALDSSTPSVPGDTWIGPSFNNGLFDSIDRLAAPRSAAAAFPSAPRAPSASDVSLPSLRGPPLA